jgi:glutathione S-transferase
MILYGNSFSPYVRKLLAYIAERGLSVEHKNITGRDNDAEFQRASPFNKMPAFTDGDFAISDSTAIITYLEAKFSASPLLPADPAARARTIWYEEFADTIMSPVVFKCFFNRIVAPKFMNQPGNEAVAVEGETIDLPPILDYLEQVVPASQGFLVGDAMSVADLSVASMFVNYHEANVAFDAAKYPKTVAWIAAMHARPSFAPVIAQEKAILASMASK